MDSADSRLREALERGRAHRAEPASGGGGDRFGAVMGRLQAKVGSAAPRRDGLGSQGSRLPPVTPAQAGGHLLFVTEGILWCKVCGAYTQKRVQQLGGACVGKNEARLRWLNAGRHPKTGRKFGVHARRAVLSDLSRW